MELILFALLVAIFLYIMYVVGKGVTKGAEVLVLLLPVALVFAWFSSILPGLLNVGANLLFLYLGMKLFKYIFNIKSKSINFILYTITCIFIWNVPSTLYPFLVLMTFIFPYRVIKNIISKRRNKLNKTHTNTTSRKNDLTQITQKELHLPIDKKEVIDVEFYH